MKVSTRSSPIAPQIDTNETNFSSKNSDFVTFRAPGLKIMLIFICPEPRGPTELLKNAKNRFQIGFSYCQEGDTKTKILCASRKRVLFSKCTLINFLTKFAFLKFRSGTNLTRRRS